MASFLAFAAGAAEVAGAWSLTVLIQVRINSWKRSLFGAGAGVGVGSGPRDTKPCMGRLRAGLPQRAGGIVKSRAEQRAET